MKHFKHEAHERAYKELVEEMYLSDEELRKPSPFLRRQLAFVYLIALYCL